MSDISYLKTNWTQLIAKFKNQKTQFLQFGLPKRLQWFGDGFSCCLIHNASSNIIGSTVKVFFFMLYLCTSSSESLQLTLVGQ